MKTTQPKTTALQLLPCKPDVCQECAVDHKPWLPHDQTSLYYQYHFYLQHHHWPTWKDAIAHCAPEVQQLWIQQLALKGIHL